MNFRQLSNLSSKQYILGIAVISLVTMISSRLIIAPTEVSFDEPISIQYKGQVEGFPVEDEVTYNFTPTDENNARIYFTMSRSEFNPYNLSESYAVTKGNDNIEIDLQSVIHPMNLERDANTQITASGDKIDLPSSLSVGQELTDRSGTLTFSTDGQVTKTIEIEVKNRRVSAKEDIKVNQSDYETYRLNYSVVVKKYYNGVLFETSEEDIQEWILPGVGFLKRISSTEGNFYSKGRIVNTYNTIFTLDAESIL